MNSNTVSIIINAVQKHEEQLKEILCDLEVLKANYQKLGGKANDESTMDK